MAEVPYQPLRVPPGWRIDWNTLFELGPTEENVRGGFFGGSVLFEANQWQRRADPDSARLPTGRSRLLACRSAPRSR